MSATPAASGTSRERRLEWLALALVLIAAFVLRTRRIELFFVGPDEGNYLHSAQIETLEHGFAPLRWIGEDVRWIAHLRANYRDVNETYQHSYLHQLLTRWLYRAGSGALQSLRLSSALTGTLTVFFAWWAIASSWPARRRTAWLAAAIVALAPLHVFFSRTGWGQVGFACFYLAYCAVLYRLLFVIPEGDRRALRRAGWSLVALSLLAFGWQEGVAPYIVGCGVVVIGAPLIQGPRRRGWFRAALRSRRTWTWVWSSIPVGLCTLALVFFNPLASLWFTTTGRAGEGFGWFQLKRLTLDNLFVQQRLDLAFSWTLIVLAIVGLFVGLRENRVLSWFLVISAGAGALILFLGFGDAFLLRAYMPVYLVAFLFAAIGLSAGAAWMAARIGHLCASIFVAAVLASLAATTWITLFGRVDCAWFVQHFYKQTAAPDADYRDVDRPILERLRTDLRANERVGVFGDKAAIYRLLDVGIHAREDYLEGPRADWPDWVVGARNGKDGFEHSPHAQKNGGEYVPVVTDTIGRWGLYRRVR